MDCKFCGGPVDDPFWDEVCNECEHEYFHGGSDPNCSMCWADADDAYEQGYQLDDGPEVQEHVG